MGLGLHLGLSKATVDGLINKYLNDAHRVTFEIFTLFFRSEGYTDEAENELRGALADIERNDLVQKYFIDSTESNL